jgi:hypothetical protein
MRKSIIAAAVTAILITTYAVAQPGLGIVKTAPLSGTGSSGSPLKITACANGEIYQSNGTTWSCVTPAAGDITGITAGSGMTGDTASGAASLAVGAGTNITVNANDVQLSTNVAVAGTLSVAAGATTVSDFRGTAISPAAITGATHDWEPTGLSTATIIRTSVTGSATLTGLTGGASGRRVTIVNLGAGDLTIDVENGGSIGDNRFTSPTNSYTYLQTNDMATYIYDATITRWRIESFNGHILIGNWNILTGVLTVGGATNIATLTTTGAAALGNDVGDAHTILGTLNVNATAGTNDQALIVSGGVPVWGIPEGRLLEIQRFATGSGTYTPTTGTKRARLRLVGGGGGGGGAAGGAAGNAASGAGGNSGVYLEHWFDTGAAITGGAYSIGALGAGGANTGGTGGTGGDTTIVINGTTYTAKGGTGGTGMVSTAAANLVWAAAGASTIGTSTTTDVMVQERGQPGNKLASYWWSGSGGSTPFGGGGGTTQDAAGDAANGYGGGGGGAAATTTNRLGGVGTIGMIIIEEYR